MKKFHLSLIVSASALLLTACGGDASEESSMPAADAETTAEASTEAPVEEAAAPAPAADDVATLDGSTLADFVANAEAGKAVFNQCLACHVVEEGVNRTGPSLAGVIGRKAGTVEEFEYSDAMAQAGITWSPEKLNQFIEDPARTVPGNRMPFGGIKSGQDRADLIAYLKMN